MFSLRHNYTNIFRNHINLQDEIYYFHIRKKRTKVIRIILGILIPIVYTIIHIPPEATMTQVVFAGVVFIAIIYFVITVLKRYRII